MTAIKNNDDRSQKIHALIHPVSGKAKENLARHSKDNLLSFYPSTNLTFQQRHAALNVVFRNFLHPHQVIDLLFTLEPVKSAPHIIQTDRANTFHSTRAPYCILLFYLCLVLNNRKRILAVTIRAYRIFRYIRRHLNEFCQSHR